MWNDPDSDGCIYDTVDCYHDCKGCEYGAIQCKKCEEWIFYPKTECDCEDIIRTTDQQGIGNG